MLIDIHACFGHWPYWDLHDKSPAELVAMMDRCGIGRAACMSLRGLFTSWREGNDETLAAAAAHPGRLVPVATISPFLGGSGEELRRLVRAGMRGVRLYPLFHSYPLDAEFVADICSAAAACGVPVVLPTRPMMNWRFKTVAIEALEALILRHPDTRFVISGPNYLIEYQALIKLMRQCANAWYEISCLQGFRAVARLAAEVGAERLLLGTGAVLHYPACNVAKLAGAGLAAEQREMIGHRNAAALLGL